MVWNYNHPGGDPRARPDFPEDMPPEMVVKRFFAKTFQWPPWWVNELTLEELEWFPVMETASDEAQETINEIATERAKREHR